ncbi:MAG: flavin reductase family protein [Proteobacteria bacterium]|nr:flavin reductase family protein [Pseudomonadota bacterium]MBU1060195.1 flavin reductase family protein [Pseudomonadota bacterium]
MKERKYLENADALMKRISKGAFLTVQAEGKVNTMTIGWATIGFVWQKEVFMVAVRDSRYTFQLLEKADDFTVTIPADKSFDKAVMFCGTKSGRDYDKFVECGLHEKEAQRVASPIIDIPGIHYECKIIYKTAMDNAFLEPSFEKLYPEKDYHTLYFAEIVACYETP